MGWSFLAIPANSWCTICHTIIACIQNAHMVAHTKLHLHYTNNFQKFFCLCAIVLGNKAHETSAFWNHTFLGCTPIVGRGGGIDLRGGCLPHEGQGAKKFGMSFETQGIPEAREKFEKKKASVQFSSPSLRSSGSLWPSDTPVTCQMEVCLHVVTKDLPVTRQVRALGCLQRARLVLYLLNFQRSTKGVGGGWQQGPRQK